jgi:hypothetical protein
MKTAYPDSGEHVVASTNLGRFGIMLEEIAVAAGESPLLPDGTSGITMEEAVSSALGRSCATDVDGQLLPDVQVTAAFGLFTDSIARPLGSGPSEALYQKVPAWIVRFEGEGVRVISSGPVGAPRYTGHEVHVIIDATSGNIIMSVS